MIDIKEIRIGNHLNHCVGYKCERVKVDEIMGGNQVAYITPDGDWAAVDAEDDWLQPIPLTAELLTELGFAKRSRYDNNKPYYIDVASAEQMEKSRLVIPQIDLEDYSEVGHPELWEVKILSTDYNFAVDHKATVRYLHELENFVFMTLHKELIEE